MTKKLFKLTYEITVYGLADSSDEAEMEGSEWLEDEVRDNGSMMDATVSEVKPGDRLDLHWTRDSIVYGSADDDEERTLGEILDEMRADAEAEKAKAPAKGQQGLPMGGDT